MSKLIDALNKVREAREGHPKAAINPAVLSPAKQGKPGLPDGLGGAVPSVLLVVVAAASIAVNVKTLVESRNVRETLSLSIARYMGEQKNELAAIRESLTRAEAAKEAREREAARFEKELKDVRAGLENLKSAAAKIEDLKVNNKLLLEKFVALNDKVKRMEQGGAQ